MKTSWGRNSLPKNTKKDWTEPKEGTVYNPLSGFFRIFRKVWHLQITEGRRSPVAGKRLLLEDSTWTQWLTTRTTFPTTTWRISRNYKCICFFFYSIAVKYLRRENFIPTHLQNFATDYAECTDLIIMLRLPF